MSSTHASSKMSIFGAGERQARLCFSLFLFPFHRPSPCYSVSSFSFSRNPCFPHPPTNSTLDPHTPLTMGRPSEEHCAFVPCRTHDAYCPCCDFLLVMLFRCSCHLFFGGADVAARAPTRSKGHHVWWYRSLRREKESIVTLASFIPEGGHWLGSTLVS
jgi:hypothetical protein